MHAFLLLSRKGTPWGFQWNKVCYQLELEEQCQINGAIPP